MEKDNEEDVAALKDTVDKLKKENKSLKLELESLKAEMSVLSKNDQQNQQQPDLPWFTSSMANKYADPKYLTTEEKKEIKFEMTAFRLNCLKYDDGNTARFYDFTRAGEEDLKKPSAWDGLTGISLGTFVTPIAGAYRFDVKGFMQGSGKAEWYICCARKEDDIYSDDESDNDSDSDDDVDRGEEDQKLKEKQRLFNEKTRRHLLFTIDTEKDEFIRDTCVGIYCEKGFLIWTDLIVTEGQFMQRQCQCMFSGRLVC